MKNIALKRISLLNFKGIRDLTLDFPNEVINIAGRNGSGKTTVFDAFVWALFGKDSQDRKAFDIKTLDGNGSAIPKLPHEVSVILDVDGEEVRLIRRYNEKWVKRRGSATEEFCGHEEERLYNDVPCSLKDWNEKINDLCPENVFKFITSPGYFAAQKPSVQRAMLIRMAGDVTDKEICDSNQSFAELIANLQGKTIEEYKREIAAKKRRIKSEIDEIPGRIDERRRDSELYANIDFAEVERTLAQLQSEYDESEGLLTTETSRLDESRKDRKQIADRYSEICSATLKRESDIKTRLSAGYYSALSERDNLQSRRSMLLSANEQYSQQSEFLMETIERMTNERDKLIQELKTIKASTPTYLADDFICPTCGQHLDVDGTERKREEIEQRFNARKEAELRANKERGMKCSRQLIAEQDAKLAEIIAKIDANRAEIEKIDKVLSALAEPIKPEENAIIEALMADNEYQSLKAGELRLREEIGRASDIDETNLKAIRDRKNELDVKIADLRSQLNRRELIERNAKRISELEELLRSQAEELARLEGIEFTIAEYAKARIEAIESKINALFGIVKFRMYAQQINGGEVETCEATVDGVPYSAQNNAMKVNMGLDIINAICKYQDITAPIFVDNCESVLDPMPTIGQQVRLIVADMPLTINQPNK